MSAGTNAAGDAIVEVSEFKPVLDRTNDAITNYPATATGTVVDTSTDTTTVSDAPAVLLGVFVNTALSAHTVVIKDNATAKITLPASLAAGTNITFPHPIAFATSLIVDPDNDSTGNITVLWRAL
jgi:hypothetical protein